MIRPMAFPIKFWAVLLICLLAIQFSTSASSDSCKYEKDIDMTLDLSDSELLEIAAAAGSLEITGVSGTDEAVIHGRVCASKEKWLEPATINTETGRRAKIDVDLPEVVVVGISFGNNYVSMDLDIKVPQDMALDIKDSSGEILLRNIGSVELQDSSGDIEIEDARGSVLINDSSGDIDIDGVAGDVTIESDSSGGIYGEDIDGAVLVERDSSGDIRFTNVSKDVIVERDSSGNITVADVGGDFRVLKDGSGSIRSSNVKGEVEIPDDH